MFNIEIKAKCGNHSKIRELLKNRQAKMGEIEAQVDTYFNVKNGRLKLRQADSVSTLIFYQRENFPGIKPSEFLLCSVNDPKSLEILLERALGTIIKIRKKRETYYIDNIKFNLDVVQELGNFIEIEASTNTKNDFNKLTAIVNEYLKLFEINSKDLLSHSYSDMLLMKNKKIIH